MKVNSIPEGKYDGYLWYSDKTEPEVLQGTHRNAIDLNQVPPVFIVEGYLYEKTTRKSYSIKMVDGRYLVQCVDIPQNIGRKDMEVIRFKPNRMKDIDFLRFIRIWKEQEDSLCEGMKVLVPHEEIFAGFKIENNSNK